MTDFENNKNVNYFQTLMALFIKIPKLMVAFWLMLNSIKKEVRQ